MIQNWIKINFKNKIKVDLYLWDLSHIIDKYDNLDEFDNLDWLDLKENKQIDSYKFLSFVKLFIEQKWIKDILMNYKDSIDWKNFSSHNWEQCILWLATSEKLKERDPKRYFSWSVPYVNYVFNNFLDIEGEIPKLKTEILNKNNPLISKYNDIFKDNNLTNLEKKFKFITEYLNEVSHTIDAAWIWGMSWATDFLQLYKYVMMEEIIEKDDRQQIMESLFITLKSNAVENFIKNYDDFIELLKQKNTNNDKRLSRLYNRLYFIFSFVLNNQNPEEFPIYFSATRNTLRVFWIEWYENVVKVYKNFLWNNEFKKDINIYLESVSIDEEKYALKDIFPLDGELKLWDKKNKITRKDLFINHAKYRFFQDICWVLNRNVLDWQDFVNNLWKWEKFNFDELKNKIYTFEKKDFYVLNEIKKLEENWDVEENQKITFWEIIKKNYLIPEWYIREVSSWEYEVIKIDDFYIWKTKTQQWIWKNNQKI